MTIVSNYPTQLPYHPSNSRLLYRSIVSEVAVLFRLSSTSSMSFPLFTTYPFALVGLWLCFVSLAAFCDVRCVSLWYFRPPQLFVCGFSEALARWGDSCVSGINLLVGKSNCFNNITRIVTAWTRSRGWMNVVSVVRGHTYVLRNVVFVLVCRIQESLLVFWRSSSEGETLLFDA